MRAGRDSALALACCQCVVGLTLASAQVVAAAEAAASVAAQQFPNGALPHSAQSQVVADAAAHVRGLVAARALRELVHVMPLATHSAAGGAVVAQAALQCLVHAADCADAAVEIGDAEAMIQHTLLAQNLLCMLLRVSHSSPLTAALLPPPNATATTPAEALVATALACSAAARGALSAAAVASGTARRHADGDDDAADLAAAAAALHAHGVAAVALTLRHVARSEVPSGHAAAAGTLLAGVAAALSADARRATGRGHVAVPLAALQRCAEVFRASSDAQGDLAFADALTWAGLEGLPEGVHEDSEYEAITAWLLPVRGHRHLAHVACGAGTASAHAVAATAGLSGLTVPLAAAERLLAAGGLIGDANQHGSLCAFSAAVQRLQASACLCSLAAQQLSAGGRDCQAAQPRSHMAGAASADRPPVPSARSTQARPEVDVVLLAARLAAAVRVVAEVIGGPRKATAAVAPSVATAAVISALPSVESLATLSQHALDRPRCTAAVVEAAAALLTAATARLTACGDQCDADDLLCALAATVAALRGAARVQTAAAQSPSSMSGPAAVLVRLLAWQIEALGAQVATGDMSVDAAQAAVAAVADCVLPEPVRHRYNCPRSTIFTTFLCCQVQQSL